MTMTEFAMVEELASLIKDNLFCKHLVLSTEEALIKFLQVDSSLEGVLELQPMSAYERLLLHRLADIYGFAHESVGEGDDRHLVLERCPDTSIPSILVSDILWQYDGYGSAASPQPILRRNETSEIKISKALPSSLSLEEREAAYIAARERIFSLQGDDNKEVVRKSRDVPVVARRMIAHALGQKVSSSPNQRPLQQCEDNPTKVAKEINHKKDSRAISTSEVNRKTITSATKSSSNEKKAYDKLSGKSSTVDARGRKAAHNGNLSVTGNGGKVAGTDNLHKEQIGAAKRIFANALGLSSSKGSKGLPGNSNGENKPSIQDV